MQDTPPDSPPTDTPAAATAPPPVYAPAVEKPRPHEPTTDETVKETIESIVIAFILAFVFRAFVIEPFIIPTGSMAPTLLGAHLQADCQSCGYRFDVGVNVEAVPEGTAMKGDTLARCPMCNYGVVVPAGTRVLSGDRILVDKFSYHLTDPSRWDVIVFKTPTDGTSRSDSGPQTNFIKRLIGLPGERICLLDGNVFVAPGPGESFAIARKTDPETNRHWQDIQRSVWQPIYHSQYVPIEDATESGPGRDGQHAWRVPWTAESGDWELGSARRPRRVYHFAGGEGVIRFDPIGAYGSVQYDALDAMYPYNQQLSGMGYTDPIEDIRLACAFVPQTDDATLSLSTTARLDRPENGIETLTMTIDTAGLVTLSATSPAGQRRELGRPASLGELPSGVATSVELWLVDDEASVWVNGKRVIVQRFDLSWAQIAQRPNQADMPELRIALKSDGPVELQRIELDRDVYYSARSGERARARRDGRGNIDLGWPQLQLRRQTSQYDAELFVLGDNQPASKDGREWTNIDGWVQQRYFDGEERVGVVPRSLLVGRAFMVYYPAPHGSTPQARSVIPDFGRVRFIH